MNHALSDCFTNNIDSQSTIFMTDGGFYLIKSITFSLLVVNTKGVLIHLGLFALLYNTSVFLSDYPLSFPESRNPCK